MERMTAQETLDRLRSLHSTIQCLEMDLCDLRVEAQHYEDQEKECEHIWEMIGENLGKTLDLKKKFYKLLEKN